MRMTDVPYIYTYIHIPYIARIAVPFNLCGARSGSPQLTVIRIKEAFPQSLQALLRVAETIQCS